jgi:hypothetical protein
MHARPDYNVYNVLYLHDAWQKFKENSLNFFWPFIWPKPGTPCACLGGKKWPENGRNVGHKTKIDPNRKLCTQLQTHLGWPEMPILLF